MRFRCNAVQAVALLAAAVIFALRGRSPPAPPPPPPWANLTGLLAHTSWDERIERFDRFAGVCLDVPDTLEVFNPEAAFFAAPGAGPAAEAALGDALGGPILLLPVVAASHPNVSGRPRVHYPGRTFLPNCLWSTWPVAGHILFGASIAMELGARKPNVPTFDRVSMVWCPFWKRWEGQFYWEFGRRVTEIAFSRWPAVGLLPDASDERFPIMRGVSCFDELYVAVRRQGILMNHADADTFLEYLAEVEPKSKHLLLPDPEGQERRKKQLCASRKLNIAVFQRSQNYKTRRFVNLPQVVRAVQNFTSVPVRVLDVNHTIPLAEQIGFFNSFDVLVTPVGSHMSAMIYIGGRKDKAVLEVGSSVRDTFWKENAERLGFNSYAISTGHTPASEKLAAGMEGTCMAGHVGDNPGQAKFCEKHCEITDDDMTVDIPLLKEHLAWTIERLCEDTLEERRRKQAARNEPQGCAAHPAMCGC
ncbi:hypothetical protein DFJ74DRAFT_669868 [Hyaloraphidium curvatum]|nr:hypothetical protein DFJ74DRAFT_669868 [Hyaloraphidium curvatum]